MPIFNMETYYLYLIVIVASFGIALLFAVRHQVSAVFHYVDRRLVKRLVLYELVPRYRYVGPVTLASVLIQITILSGNILCLTVKANSIAIVGSRAAYLSLVNMSVSVIGSHLNAFGEGTGIGLRNQKRLHRAMGCLSFAHGLTHGVIIISLQGHLTNDKYSFVVLHFQHSNTHILTCT